ncbi:GNAT family N-acetyltransferase [Pedobacter nyackensis]|uniref:Ribosomal protein S18 acetylase RimI n=1 Tax=Pedobacter nyackensis TaxID=475255 RepID=A0A1W2AB73_9SPHI|nr:GNAT family N-acetyltransferase [Pedobacter nyackensis]SMC57894.1 Ribosomal protein S18 acetylase RimI [Pedobacter nyackensis]
MDFREAKIEDIQQIHVVRNSVTENTLSNPDLITYDDYVEFLTVRGKGWVCEIDGQIVGFSIVDLKEENIWALFLSPAFEGKGIGKRLQDLILNWYFSNGKDSVWLGTVPNTRAAGFYEKSGWKEIGWNGEKEIKFEMTKASWMKLE